MYEKIKLLKICRITKGILFHKIFMKYEEILWSIVNRYELSRAFRITTDSVSYKCFYKIHIRNYSTSKQILNILIRITKIRITKINVIIG